ncbi:hypothetical protein Tco_0511429 [Tanacetum coccineum]
MSTREQHTPTIPTSVVRNTGGRSGPQGLEEPTSDELYGDEIRRNPRNYEESHYPNLIRLQPPETEPRRRHGNKSTPEVPSPIASSSETQRNITSFTPGPMLAGERREVYTKVGEKNKAHLHVLHPPPRKKAARKR